MDFREIVSAVNSFAWGPVMIILLVGTGIFLTIRLKALPWRNLGYALKSVFRRHPSSEHEEGDISPFQSLMTALAATIGTGNIAGVATAMVLGGPGALVWMWVSALFGLSTKYAESVLAVKFRVTNSRGEMAGGPMYAMRNGFKIKWLGKLLAVLFAVFAVIASFGIGNMTQTNSITGAINTTFGVPTWITGLIVTLLAGIVLIGGIKSIGKVCGIVVPVMAVFYVIGGLIVIFANLGNLGAGLGQIFGLAFQSPADGNFSSAQAMVGGFAGALISMRFGVARGLFSNEAGLGSAPIAAAAAKTDSAARQGYINMTGTFFDTIVVCTITGLAIACSGILGQIDPSTGEALTGVNLTIAAFSSALGPVGGYIVTIGITLFAFSTILGWEYYGEKSLEYLVSKRPAIMGYRILFSLIVFLPCLFDLLFGASGALSIVWDMSEVFNGLMAIPNLICLLILSGVVARETNRFQKESLIPERILAKREKAAKKAA